MKETSQIAEPSAEAMAAADALGNVGKLHRWPESPDKIMEAARIIDSSFAELRSAVREAGAQHNPRRREGEVKLFARNRWEVRRTIWPYPDGWGTYNPATRTILDTGLPTKERAQEICDGLNGKKPAPPRKARSEHPFCAMPQVREEVAVSSSV